MEALLFFAGLVQGCLVEYLVHRYLFHGLGKKKDSRFAYHLRDHHLVSRRNDFIDKKLSVHEAIGVIFLIALHVPALFVSAYLFLGIAVYASLFVILHNMMHKTPEIGKKYFWWHWNHHMRNQNKSWNVVFPLFDLLTGTLQKKD